MNGDIQRIIEEYTRLFSTHDRLQPTSSTLCIESGVWYIQLVWKYIKNRRVYCQRLLLPQNEEVVWSDSNNLNNYFGLRLSPIAYLEREAARRLVRPDRLIPIGDLELLSVVQTFVAGNTNTAADTLSREREEESHAPFHFWEVYTNYLFDTGSGGDIFD